MAAVLAGCAGSMDVFENAKEGGLFSKPVKIFATPDWAYFSSKDQSVSLGPSGPVALEDLVGADGSCAPAVAQAPPAAPSPAPAEEAKPAEAASPPPPPADRPVGSIAGDLAGPPMPPGPPPKPKAAAAPEPKPGLPPASPQVIGGLVLGMTECGAVRRAGPPSNVSIGANATGARKVVLTYLTGARPGIYTFESGRLKIIDRAPEPPAPPKAPPKKKRTKKPAKPKTAAAAKSASQNAFERAYVQ
jgi:hypothetical protein